VYCLISATTTASLNVTLIETARNPTNTIVSKEFLQLKPEATGKYTLAITNLRREFVNVDRVFGYIPLYIKIKSSNLNSLGRIILA
jgi:hypothetical protein